MRLTLFFVIIAAMVIGCYSQSHSRSCSYVNGKEICEENYSRDGNSASASSGAHTGGGSSGQFANAGTGNSRTREYDFSHSQAGAPFYPFPYPAYDPYNSNYNPRPYNPPGDPFDFVFGRGGFPGFGGFGGSGAYAGAWGRKKK